MSDARAPRRDAVRNRERLVEAAALAFREDGLGASVNAIAERAGVNVATLYRHFPTKDHLTVAVLDAVVEPLALATERSGDSLATFLREAVRLQAEHRGLGDVLGRYPTSADVRERLRDRAIEIVTPVVERAHRAGELRSDFDALDLLIALRMLMIVADAPQADRHVDMVLRGLRPERRGRDSNPRSA